MPIVISGFLLSKVTFMKGLVVSETKQADSENIKFELGITVFGMK